MSHPLPQLDDENRAFWTKSTDGQLAIMQCETCSLWVHPPGSVCPDCLTETLGVQMVSGRGKIYSYTINHQQWTPGLEVPFALVVVELAGAKGVRLTARLEQVDLNAIEIGQPVQSRIKRVEDVNIPYFVPA